MAEVLQVVDAAKSFGAAPALRGARLRLEAGEWVALLGPNGAGKTTLVRSIAGRVRLDAGELTLLDARVDRPGSAARAARQRLGVVPQEIALYEKMTARENLEIFGKLNGMAGSTLAQRMRWALEWTGLADRAGDLVRTFSGGMKRRLNIACAVLHEPEVLLLDEPTVGVDPQSRQRIWEMLDGLRQRGTALLLTTHQLDEAEKVCQRIVIIDHGQTIADGTLDELISRTVGRERQVTLVLDREPAAGQFGDGLEVVGSVLRCQVDEVAVALPPLLERVRAAGLSVLDVQVAQPSLHAVFIHLTGRELRE